MDCSGTSVNNTKLTTPDNNSPKKDAYKSSFQSIEGTGEIKNNEHKTEKFAEEEKNKKSNNDSPKKRRGPLLPLPSKFTKEDSQRYISYL